MNRVLVSVVALFFLALTSLGCQKPQPPQLTPKSAAVTGVTITGVDLRLQVDAMNPNTIDLTTQSVTAKVMVKGTYDLGTATVASTLTLPAGKTTTIDVRVSVKWSDLTQLATLAATSQGQAIPYTVDGTATVGGASLNVDVPFHIDGTMTAQQLTQAAAASLPSLMQGLPKLN